MEKRNAGIMEQIDRVVQMNIEDAERLVKLFRENGDTESLNKALADLEKWKKKAAPANG